MIKKILIVCNLLFIVVSIFSLDPSTPLDGNLYNPMFFSFNQYNLLKYNNTLKLKNNGLVISDNRIIYSVTRDVLSPQIISNINIGSDNVHTEDGIVVVLTGNSSRYEHGILGDKNEPIGFVVYNNGIVIGTYELEGDKVFETLRPTIADIIPENPGNEILLTTSDNKSGARVEVYSLEGVLLGSSDPIGLGYRWLHLLGVAPLGNSYENRVVLIQTPHIGGILKLLKWNGSKLVLDKSINGVSTHTIGSDNLNMAILFNSEILVPDNSFRSLKLIKVVSNKLKVIKEFKLPGRLNTNIFYDKNTDYIWLGTDNGFIVNLKK